MRVNKPLIMGYKTIKPMIRRIKSTTAMAKAAKTGSAANVITCSGMIPPAYPLAISKRLTSVNVSDKIKFNEMNEIRNKLIKVVINATIVK